MSASERDGLAVIIAEATNLLECAASASFGGDFDEETRLVEATAAVLYRLFLEAPESVPQVTHALSKAAPVVEPALLAGACDIASDAACEQSGEVCVLFAPRCWEWVTEACDRHLADRSIVLRGFASGAEERARSAGVEEFRAMHEVAEAHCAELELAADRLRELLGLMGPAFTEGATLDEAIETLSGPERVRAEEIRAGMPAVVSVGGA